MILKRFVRSWWQELGALGVILLLPTLLNTSRADTEPPKFEAASAPDKEIVNPWPGQGPQMEPCDAVKVMPPDELQAFYLGEINKSLQGIQHELQRIIARMDRKR